LAICVWPSASSTWSTLTPPSRRPLALLRDGRLQLARVDVICLYVVLNAADKHRHNRLDGAVHFAFIDA
jgi:hypothetical protein